MPADEKFYFIVDRSGVNYAGASGPTTLISHELFARLPDDTVLQDIREVKYTKGLVDPRTHIIAAQRGILDLGFPSTADDLQRGQNYFTGPYRDK